MINHLKMLVISSQIKLVKYQYNLIKINTPKNNQYNNQKYISKKYQKHEVIKVIKVVKILKNYQKILLNKISMIIK
jgi:hypothetical protein